MSKETLMVLTERREFLLRLLEEEQEAEDEELAAEVRDQLAEMLAVTEGDWRQKIDDYVAVYRSLKGREAALKAEAKHLQDMARTAARQAERLRERVLFVADLRGVKRFKGHTRSIGVSESGFSVQVEGPVHRLPLAFRDFTPGNWRADRKAIADHIKSGGDVPAGVTTHPTKQVRFR